MLATQALRPYLKQYVRNDLLADGPTDLSVTVLPQQPINKADGYVSEGAKALP
jgi:hypothetical protein